MEDVVPVKQKTKVGLRADMTIDDEPVAVEGVIGDDFFLQLNKPATIGTPVSFAYWLKDKYKVSNLEIMMPFEKAEDFKRGYKNYKQEKNQAKKDEFKEKIKEHLKKNNIPEQVHELLTSAFLAELTVTDLLIQYKHEKKNGEDVTNRKLMFGLSVGFPAPLALLPNIDVNKLSILIMNAPEGDFNFPERIALPSSTPLIVQPSKAAGFIKFSANPQATGKIKLGDDNWIFVASDDTVGAKQVALGDTLSATLAALANTLNRQDTGEASRCTYRADLEEGQLEITFKDEGFAGNEFVIDADPKSNGKPSAESLKGGVGEAPPRSVQASGKIVFSALPEEADTITLNGVVWGFTKAERTRDEKKSKIGADVPKTLKELAENLNNSVDPDISKCSYASNASTLNITSKKAGPDGEKFAIAASKAEPSGPKLSLG